MNILISAYAVCPEKGSEPGMGWNWISNIAKYCIVHVITEGEWREEIDRAVEKLEWGSRMHFYYIPVSSKIRKMCWKQGDWRFYYYYHLWQRLALLKAEEICGNIPISLIHQLNMIGFREPGLLWEIKDIPVIWGPVGGFGGIPYRFSKEFGIKSAFKQCIKNFANKIQIYQPNVYNAIRYSTQIIAATSEAQIALQKYRKDSVFLLNETGSSRITKSDRDFNSVKLKIIWVGKRDHRKGLDLALKTMRKLINSNLELHVVGVEKSALNQLLIKDLHNVYFYSWIPHHEVQTHFNKCHILLFTSLHEGTPHAVIEALSNGLPVICHDICGHGDVIDASCGIKIPLIDPQKSVLGFSEAILELVNNRSQLKKLSQGAYQHAEEILWEKKAQSLLKIYDQALVKKN